MDRDRGQVKPWRVSKMISACPRSMARNEKSSLSFRQRAFLELSRGDWTPIELFGAVVEAWEDHLHAFLVAA
jgi:hypothetical protein